MTDDEVLAKADEIKERSLAAMLRQQETIHNRIERMLESVYLGAAFPLEALRFAAFARCQCAAGLAYPKGCGPRESWVCSDILRGIAAPDTTHDEPKPFAFYEIKSEDQPSANGATTRPAPEGA